MVLIPIFKKKIYQPDYLVGKYKIVKLIGEGRFGICYLVYAQKEEYLFKQIKSKTMKKYKDKIIFEQQILASIEYPFIPKIIDIINRDGIYGYILEYKKGIVHRDIRLPNVIVDEKDVHLIDFGLARPIDNKKYICFEDFLYLGHLLIHLHYSSLKKPV